jgi:hypothetical protein
MAADLSTIRRAIGSGDYLLTRHALSRLASLGVTLAQMEEAFGDDEPEVLEDYPHHRRGPCCLLLGWDRSGRPQHCVAGYGGSRLSVTIYEPDPRQWVDYRRRR